MTGTGWAMSLAGGTMRLIVTGGAGFIGSAAVCRAVRDGHDVLTIDKLTYAGRREALSEVMASPHHSFLKADVADSDAMGAALRDFDPDAVLHLAAETHVAPCRTPRRSRRGRNGSRRGARGAAATSGTARLPGGRRCRAHWC